MRPLHNPNAITVTNQSKSKPFLVDKCTEIPHQQVAVGRLDGCVAETSMVKTTQCL